MHATAHNVVTIAEAAKRLGRHEATLWEWLRDGAPVARRGRRGRGGVTTLVDVEALQAWRARMDAQPMPTAPSADAGALRELTGVLPELVTRAAWETFLAATGPHKRAFAGELAAMTLRVLGAVYDRLDGAMAPVTEATLPEEFKRLRKISS